MEFVWPSIDSPDQFATQGVRRNLIGSWHPLRRLVHRTPRSCVAVCLFVTERQDGTEVKQCQFLSVLRRAQASKLRPFLAQAETRKD